MRIRKCVDCLWYPETQTLRKLCAHPDAELDPITGKKVNRRTVADMRFAAITVGGDEFEMEGAEKDGLCGIEARLFELKVDPLR